MSETRTIEQAIFHFLHTIPETWTGHDPSTLSALQEQAVEQTSCTNQQEGKGGKVSS